MMSDTEAAFSHKREMKGAIFCESISLRSCQMQIRSSVFGGSVFVSGLHVC